MQNIFLGESYKSLPTGLLKKVQVKDFKYFCKDYLQECKKGGKFEKYVVIGDSYKLTRGDSEAPNLSYKRRDHYHRNNESQVSAWLLPLDGDSSVNNKDSCIPPRKVHLVLKKLNYNHVIYTTHSHTPGTKNRWRLLIPCRMSDKSQLSPTVQKIYKEIAENGCPRLALSEESKTWSVPWFLPTREDLSDGFYEYYGYFDGVDKVAEAPAIIEDTSFNYGGNTSLQVPKQEKKCIQEILEIISRGEPDTGLHEATRDIANGLIRDGLAPAFAKAILHQITSMYSRRDPRQIENKDKINLLVDSAYKKNNMTESRDWEKVPEKNKRVYTRYPDQGGAMEKLVQVCMAWMLFPNRQIAVTACHALVSTLGGRVYTLPEGGGIVLTTLITGRSTIGKSNVKKFCQWVLNSFQMGNTSQDFIGSHFYTSSKNLVDELRSSGTLLSVRTESGQTDQSQAGDMNRVLLYELELATESGRTGYVSSGGQNTKIPDLYSPSVTTVRESVAEIQSEADVKNATSVSGVAGRRSHVIIDPVKKPMNHNHLKELPKFAKKKILSLYKKASDERRKIIEKALPEALWIELIYADRGYIEERSSYWLHKENKAAESGNPFESTFYGRLYQRVPAFAARLAIVDDPEEPIITNTHLRIAEESLTAEFDAHKGQQASGELDDPWSKLVTRIVEIFQGDMTKKKTLKASGKKMLKDGACEWSRISQLILHSESYKFLKGQGSFHYNLRQHLAASNITLMERADTVRLYGRKSKIFKRE